MKKEDIAGRMDAFIEKKQTAPGILHLIENKIGSWEPYLPFALVFLYFAVMIALTFIYHNIPGLGVETDFIAELVPQVKKLLAGHFSPANYGAKGPVYSIFLTGFYLVFREYFVAGLALNIVSASVFLGFLYFTIKKIFNSITALIVLIAVMFNFMFQSYTYQAGSDTLFMALCTISIYFMFRGLSKKDIVLSGFFGLLAMLTRYNGAFIPAGAFLFYLFSEGVPKERLKRLGLWLAVFIVTGLPWFIPNTIVNGSPMHNDNHINVALEFYALAKGASYESWENTLPKKFSGIGDIILYDPVYFGKHFSKNIYLHLKGDILLLTGKRLGVFIVAGFLLMFFVRPRRDKIIFFIMGFLHFLILAMVFYNPRFSLMLLVFYLPLAVWPFTSGVFQKKMKVLTLFMLAVIGGIVVSYTISTSVQTFKDISADAPYLLQLKDLGQVLDKAEPDKTAKVIARKPHVAYYAGLEAHMFPTDKNTVESLVEYCRSNGIKYIVYTGIEAHFRPEVKNDLFNIGNLPAGLTLVHYNQFGAVYKVF